ncbi:MAG: hypothetical protein CVU05_09355 [Bacteroidetes bacterium HGW-Bacteroidetes-21]|jgi:excinuclease UvrABC nuclease subunit|nr:MAG: hypothetical protein CVU05_09355 [Bacteroidetes bacterium HGW-Bacteroidetes-21]
MAEQTLNQTFDGYWREPNKSGLPKSSGVYCVYECTHNTSEKTVSIHKLIYIGEAADVNQRVATHDRLEDWKKHVRQGNELCYSFTPVDSYYRERVEAAFIFRHKPPENTEYVKNFPFDKTIVKSTGKIALIDEFFVANTTK